jgi:hypothetical protein
MPVYDIAAEFLLLTVASPWIAPYDPYDQDLSSALSPPSSERLFGADQYGWDILKPNDLRHGYGVDRHRRRGRAGCDLLRSWRGSLTPGRVTASSRRMRSTPRPSSLHFNLIRLLGKMQGSLGDDSQSRLHGAIAERRSPPPIQPWREGACYLTW